MVSHRSLWLPTAIFITDTSPLSSSSLVCSSDTARKVLHNVSVALYLCFTCSKCAKHLQNVNYILSHLRTSPPPKISASTPLLSGHPPPSHLPLNPILYLTLAIDSVAPLLRLRSQKGAAGGGAALQIPIPLGLRRRRRTAMMWILTAATKKKNRGSGRNMLAQRIAEEVISVVEGRSSVWDLRNNLHKQGVAARANMFSKFKNRR